MDMVAPASSQPLPATSLLCDTCHCALILAGTNALLVGRCAPCVKRVALAAKGIPTAPRLTWDYVSRFRGSVIVATYGADRASYRVESGALVECNGRLPDDAFAELEHDVFANQHYRGDVPAQAPVARVTAEDGAPRADMLDALGLGLCGCCGELAVDCRKQAAGGAA